MKLNLVNYYDYAAATPMDPKVLGSMEPYFTDNFFNPSAIYLSARRVRQDLEEARHQIAMIIGARASEIIFTAGGTEANNLVINGVSDGKILVSAIEHDSILKSANSRGGQTIKVNKKGIIELDDLKSKLDDSVSLVSVMYVNNEVGSIQPIKEIAELIKSVRHDRLLRHIKKPIYLHIDACQAANYLDLSVSRLGVDLMSVNGGKIYGPKQSGFLFVRSGVILRPLIQGGGQEQSLRSGTENIPGIIGLAKALEITKQKQKGEAKRLIDLRDYLIKELKSKIPTIVINGSTGNKRIANNIHFSLEGIDNEYLLMQLDELGFMVAVGSACQASSDEPSHVLKAMGFDENQMNSSIRLSLGRFSTKDGIDNLLKSLVSLTS